MATIDELTPEQIRNPEIFQKIKDLGDSFVRCIQAKEAYFLQEKLTALLKTSNLSTFNPELYKNYQDLLVLLKWTVFPILLDEETLEVLSNHYLTVLDNENIDVQDRIEAKMFTKDLFPRNELRQKMQRALRENKERLRNKTFGEWLLDYDKTFDFRERDELTHLQYVRQNPIVQTLSEPEKNKLRKALQVFDKTLLVTPVMSEPLLSMAIRAMIKGGIIKEQINPALLQPSPVFRVAPKPEERSKIIPPLAPPLAKEPIVTKEKKPGFLEKLFGKKEKEPTSPGPASQRGELVSPGLKKPAPKPTPLPPKPPAPPAYEKKIFEIPTFFKEKKAEAKSEKKEKEPQPTTLPPMQYRIRTMKQDIEQAKKQPIPPKPEPKIKDNIVDLSGK